MTKAQIVAETVQLSRPFHWPREGVTRVPYRIFSDPEIYKMEQERIFRGPMWHFLCLELDVPDPGDFRTNFVGEVPVIVTRDETGSLNAMVNRCAHKGALVCHQPGKPQGAHLRLPQLVLRPAGSSQRSGFPPRNS